MKRTVFNVIIRENPEDAALAAAQTQGEKPKSSAASAWTKADIGK